jgi:hypothetical protein
MELLSLAIGWLPPLVTLAALAGSYFCARRRADYRPRDPSNERTDRIWRSAALFTVRAVAPVAISLLISGFLSGFLFALTATSILGVAALVLIILIDLVVVKPLEAKRSGGWMVAAPLIFAFVFLAFLLVPVAGLAGLGGAALFEIGSLCILGDAAAAGLCWWAYLPLDEADLRRTFE